MKPRQVIFALSLLFLATAAFAFQREFRDLGGERPIPLPHDYKDPAEFVFGRLMYPGGGFGGFGRRFGGGGDWRTNAPPMGWGNDYPAADRHLMVALRRLTFINARSVEQPVNLEDGDDIFNWPFLFVGRPTDIELNKDMTNKLREYLNRGGFLICDDMWGEGEQQAVKDLVDDLYPMRGLTELGDGDTVMHTVYDLKDRYQIIGQWGMGNGFQPLRPGSGTPHWTGVFDEKNRMVMAAWLNNDTGDSWEWADYPAYPEHYSALGFRIVINHIIYTMTH